jgi:hypothetical protein
MATTFVGYSLSADSNRKLLAWCQENKINEQVDDFHVTLLVGNKVIDENEDLKEPIIIDSRTYLFKIFNYRIKNTPALVLTFKSSLVENKHYSLLKKHKLVWDFNEYIPHISLSYNFNSDINTLAVPDFNIELDSQYTRIKNDL